MQSHDLGTHRDVLRDHKHVGLGNKVHGSQGRYVSQTRQLMHNMKLERCVSEEGHTTLTLHCTLLLTTLQLKHACVAALPPYLQLMPRKWLAAPSAPRYSPPWPAVQHQEQQPRAASRSGRAVLNILCWSGGAAWRKTTCVV